jgi:hypothetical protein
MKKAIFGLISIILLGSFASAYSQTQFRHKVVIRGHGKPTKDTGMVMKEQGGYEMYQIKKVPKIDSLHLLKDYKLTRSQEFKVKGINYELAKDSLIAQENYFLLKTSKPKAERFYLDNGKYKANLSISKDSILINFWLWEKNKKTYYGSTPEERTTFPFDPQTKYFMQLKNRQFESFYYTNYELAILTIPFKCHFGYNTDGKTVDPVFNTNINISTFLGKRMGRASYSYDMYKGMVENNWSVTLGAFLGIGAQKLDSASTSLSEIPLSKEADIPAVSYGLGLLFNISDFNLGVFLGWDKGLGEIGEKWNFDNKPWLGFGFGYKLAFLGKPE